MLYSMVAAGLSTWNAAHSQRRRAAKDVQARPTATLRTTNRARVGLSPPRREDDPTLRCIAAKQKHRVLGVAWNYAALLSTAVMAIIGILGLWLGRPWLFPSLGPTIFLQTVTPNSRGARLWNTLVGHGVGIAAAFAALFLMGAERAPSVMSVEFLTAGRIAATALAVGIQLPSNLP